MSVDFQHPQYERSLPRWKMIRDICDAENLKDHLVRRNPQDLTPENKIRNDQIFKRASFSAVAGYTASGMLGLAFSKPPKVEVPAGLEYLLEDADGAGNSIYQIAQQSTLENIKFGRGGFLVDFPTVEGESVSVADMRAGRAFATIVQYKAEQIINWKTERVGSKLKLSLVTLKAVEDIQQDDGFSVEQEDVILELRLLEGRYTVSEWRYDKKSREWYRHKGPMVVRDGRGNPMDTIPFVFFGSESDNHTIDRAPMYDIARLNRDHYNNSAIYEDSVYIVGQVQPWMSGLTQDHIDLLSENNMYVGSGRMLGVPAGEQFGMAQAQPNTLAKEAMQDKVDMMVSIGAMFLQRGTVAKTATQAADEKATRHSVLTLIVQNISEALTKAAEWCGVFMNVDGDALIEINQDFVDPEASPQELQQIIAGFIQGAIPASDYIRYMKSRDYFDGEKPDEDYLEDVNAGIPGAVDTAGNEAFGAS